MTVQPGISILTLVTWYTNYVRESYVDITGRQTNVNYGRHMIIISLFISLLSLFWKK
jgi:hypothetical protein